MLKLAYVGMSRPFYLLCVAIQAEELEGHEADFIDSGWNIVSVQHLEGKEENK